MAESADAKWDGFVAWCEEHGFEAVAPEHWDDDGEAGDADITLIGGPGAGDPKEQPAG